MDMAPNEERLEEGEAFEDAMEEVTGGDVTPSVLIDDGDDIVVEPKGDGAPSESPTASAMEVTAVASSASTTWERRAQPDVQCGFCKESHPARKCVKLSGCQDRVGSDCLRKYLDTLFKGDTSKDAPTCPCCNKGIVWSDVQLSLGLVPFARLTEKLRIALESVWAQPSIVCAARLSQATSAVDSAAATCGRTAKRKSTVLGVGAEFLRIKCPRPSCKNPTCGACGSVYGGDEGAEAEGEGEEDEKEVVLHTAAGSDLHECPAQVILAVHKALQDLKAATHDPAAKRASASKSKAPKTTKTAWSRGTGYGGGQDSLNTEVVEKAQQRQRETDEQVAAIFTVLTREFARFSQHAWVSRPRKGGAFQGALACMALQAVVSRSTLETVIYRLLRNDSLIDIINSRSKVYMALFDLMETMARDNLFVLTLNTSNPYNVTMRGVAVAKSPLDAPVQDAAAASPGKGGKQGGRQGGKGSKRKAEPAEESLEVTVVEELNAEAEEEEKSRTSMMQLMSGLQKQGRILGRTQAGKSTAVDPPGLVPRVDAVTGALSKAIKALPFHLSAKDAITLDEEEDDSGAGAAGGEGAVVSEEEAKKQREAEYVEAMKPIQFRVISMDYYTHAFKSEILSSSSASTKKDRMRRISQEISTLSTSLPLHYDSSIFLRVDESRPDVIRALLIGPEGTPYANGCFIFDIFLPPAYPEVSPKVVLTTTGGGKVRFNPNLYKCGKVCLSLLGTWQGPGWDPKHSTLLQVLLSIQSLIMVEEPIYNEPGYERSRMDTESQVYNTAIRFHTLDSAIIPHLMTPSQEFNAVIRKHISSKKDAILKQMEKCLKDAETPIANKVYVNPWGIVSHSTQLHDTTTPTMAEVTRMAEQLKSLLEQQPAQATKAETITLE